MGLDETACLLFGYITFEMGIFLVILLMVLLGMIEGPGGDDLGDNRRGIDLRLIAFLLRDSGDLPLPGVMVKDHRAILDSHIRALSVYGGGIVNFPE